MWYCRLHAQSWKKMDQHKTKLLVTELPQDLNGIRILMYAPCLGKFGGIETFCLTLIEDLVHRGAIVRLLRKKVNGFATDGSIEAREQEITSKWSNQRKDSFSSFFVDRGDPIIKKSFQRCEIVHLHNPLAEGLLMARLRSLPCVMTIYNWQRKGWNPRLLGWRWAVRNADRRWYISEFVWDSWEKKRKKGSKRLPVISKMPVGDQPISSRKGFLFLGRWIENKGLRILIKAYAGLKLDPEKWPLILAGDGPLRKEVEGFVTEKKIKGVHILGFVSEKKRHEITRSAKWMVTVPHTKEDLGLTPLEARSVGVPCIVSKDGGLKETGGQHALTCEPGCVRSLRDRLQQATTMTEEEYLAYSKLAKENLTAYVRPLDDYSKEYLKLLS